MLFFTDFAKDADVSVGQCHHILLVSPHPVHHLLDCQLWSTGIKEAGQSRMAYRCLIGIGPAAYIQFFGRHYVTEPARCNTSSKVWYCLCAKSASKSESACRANPI